jgi:hypothetical protein
MTIDNIVRAFAGTMILASVVLSQYHHPYWLFLTGFVGFNLLQYAFSGFCPLVIILKLAGFKEGCCPDKKIQLDTK